MESLEGMADGQWNSFSAIYSGSTEESDFMAQLLNNFSLPNDLPNTSDVGFPWSGHESDVNMAVVEESPMHSSDDTTSANMYSFSQGSCYTSGGSSNFLFPESSHQHVIYYPPSNSRPILRRTDSSVSPNYNETKGENMITSSSDHQMYTDNYLTDEGDDFLNQDVSNDSMESGENQHEAGLEGNNLRPEKSSEDKADNLSQISKKRSWTPTDVQKNKRMVKAKKTDDEKLNLTDIINNGKGHPVLHRQSSSSCLSEDDSNASHEFNGGVLLPSCSNSKVTSTALNLNGKTRASRGSATGPQSLYARKRREKINERLKILQNLVPNGTKVDISTMLEEAVQYVKFLQLQIKLLSSDDLWMYAPIAYNGMDIGLDLKISTTLKS